MNELVLVKQTDLNGIILDCYVEPNQQDKSDFWATREQIGMLLEYEYPREAISKIHQRNKERLDKFSTEVKLTLVEGGRKVSRDVVVYNFKGLLEVCRYSNQAGAGYQYKIAGNWEPLELGEPYAVMQDTGKAHSDGTPVRQLKWNSSILDVFEQLMEES